MLRNYDKQSEGKTEDAAKFVKQNFTATEQGTKVYHSGRITYSSVHTAQCKSRIIKNFLLDC